MSEEVVIHEKQEEIAPFWQKLPFFFRFPFRPGPLIFMMCIVAASALAGFALGGMGLAFKGFLAYIGLRYAFNVLELFSQGRFEGESVDYTLWGPEKRPAKFGLVVTLFVVLAFGLGNALLQSRIASNPAVQEQLVELYKNDHAEELAQREREREALNKRIGLDAAPVVADGAEDDGPSEQEGPDAAAVQTSSDMHDAPAVPGAAANAVADDGMDRAEIYRQYRPTPSSPLWYKLQPYWYWLLLLLLSLMLPAAAIVIALEDKFFKALNPAHIIFLTKSMGRSYFVLWGFFLLIAGARQLAMSSGEQLPVWIRFPLEMGVATYLGLVLFAMIGYALYQFHQELGLDVKVDFNSHRKAGGAEAIAKAGSSRAAILAAEPKDPLERKVQALVAAGKIDEAIAEVKDGMRYDRYDPDLNTRLHALYVLQGDPVIVLAHGQQWLTGLTRAGRDGEALAALRALLALDAGFAIEDGDAVLPMAKAAAQKRDHVLAISLVRGFDKRFPQHKDIAAIFFLGARLSSEHLRKHESAVRILRMVLTNFPQDPIAPEAKNYLAVLEATLAQNAP